MFALYDFFLKVPIFGTLTLHLYSCFVDYIPNLILQVAPHLTFFAIFLAITRC